MLTVEINFRPHGNKSQAQKLHRIRIINQGTGTKELGDYSILLNTPSAEKGRRNTVVGIGRFPRERGTLALVFYALGCLLEFDAPRVELEEGTTERTPEQKAEVLAHAQAIRQRIAAKGQTFDTAEEVRRSREELGETLKEVPDE